ncbi:MAG: hypothetical protein H0W24_02215 [Lysobacter sp.]|nr:hypothetical protein [Lysobacter sp.]MDQ3269479.1 hypothetical protein [Pseudomonadota bacterium]
MNRNSHRPLLGSLIGAGLLSLAFGASAHDPALHANLDTSAQSTATATARAEASADAESLAQLDAHRSCLRHTGTRISTRSRRNDKDCVGANGRVYSREDINSTGSVELADALRRLDPSIR